MCTSYAVPPILWYFAFCFPRSVMNSRFLCTHFLLTLLLAVCIYGAFCMRYKVSSGTTGWKMNRVRWRGSGRAAFYSGFAINISWLNKRHRCVHYVYSRNACFSKVIHTTRHYEANHMTMALVFYVPAVFNGVFLWNKLFIPGFFLHLQGHTVEWNVVLTTHDSLLYVYVCVCMWFTRMLVEQRLLF